VSAHGGTPWIVSIQRDVFTRLDASPKFARTYSENPTTILRHWACSEMSPEAPTRTVCPPSQEVSSCVSVAATTISFWRRRSRRGDAFVHRALDQSRQYRKRENFLDRAQGPSGA
jgi:hypothetical protein